MSKFEEELLSPENLKSYFKDAAANLSDDELKDYIRNSFSEADLKAMLLEPIPDLMEEARASGKLTEEQLKEQETALTEQLSSPKSVNSLREVLANNPEMIAQIRETIANPDNAQLDEMRETIKESTGFVVGNNIMKAFENGHVDATIWGITGGAQAAVARGSTSRMAALMGFGRKVPYVGAIVVGGIESAFAIQDFKNGDVEAGSKKIGGTALAVGATVATGALLATVTAPAWVPVVAAAAVGTAAYYVGREAGDWLTADLQEAEEIYKSMDERAKRAVTGKLYHSLGHMTNYIHGDSKTRNKLIAAGVEARYSRSGSKNEIGSGNLKDGITDPVIGDKVKRIMRDRLEEVLTEQKAIMKENDSWAPRWLRFDDGVSKRQLAKHEVIKLEKALNELDGWQKNYKQMRSANDALIVKELDAFNKLPPEIQKAMEQQLDDGYEAYQKSTLERILNGNKFREEILSHRDYMNAGKIRFSKDEKVLRELRESIKEIFEQASNNTHTVNELKLSTKDNIILGVGRFLAGLTSIFGENALSTGIRKQTLAIVNFEEKYKEIANDDKNGKLESALGRFEGITNKALATTEREQEVTNPALTLNI